MDVIFQCIPFNAFSVESLYQVMQLRQEVFVVEQDCPYLDADGRDPRALHVLGVDNTGDLVAYSRLFSKGIIYEKYAAIGRVVTASKVRGKGVGISLMRESIQQLKHHFGDEPIKISAQYHLRAFYEALGFRTIGEQYMEDGIPHIGMIRKGS